MARLASPAQQFVVGEALIALTLLDEKGETNELLRNLGTDRDAVCEALEGAVRDAAVDDTPGSGPSFSELLAAADAARVSLGHSRVQPGHLVLAVLSCDCYGKDVLLSCGLTREHAWEAIRGLYT